MRNCYNHDFYWLCCSLGIASYIDVCSRSSYISNDKFSRFSAVPVVVVAACGSFDEIHFRAILVIIKLMPISGASHGVCLL